ncbi:hypothetical protein HU762_21965 [Pseudomonas sp. SWRI92]|uniref:hypothetical protein n=1 Tax=Pseudomonas sp. SWRI92 TaxID=2745499 RepID=UPI00164847B3|nr:hypothetical protein [Pseudomonas sp. SWRI92]MBC3376614.1 hypothetical protein [Pseudomonas sp. SWRI92]
MATGLRTVLFKVVPLQRTSRMQSKTMVNAWWKQKDSQLSARQASGQRLRNLLEEYDIAPSAFAEVLRVSPQCLTNWSVRGVPRLWMAQLARLLSVSEVWLVTGEGERARDIHRELEQKGLGLEHIPDESTIPFRPEGHTPVTEEVAAARCPRKNANKRMT